MKVKVKRKIRPSSNRKAVLELMANKIVDLLDSYKSLNPNANIVIDAPNGEANCKLSDALIYTDDYNNIVLDAE